MDARTVTKNLLKHVEGRHWCHLCNLSKDERVWWNYDICMTFAPLDMTKVRLKSGGCDSTYGPVSTNGGEGGGEDGGVLVNCCLICLSWQVRYNVFGRNWLDRTDIDVWYQSRWQVIGIGGDCTWAVNLQGPDLCLLWPNGVPLYCAEAWQENASGWRSNAFGTVSTALLPKCTKIPWQTLNTNVWQARTLRRPFLFLFISIWFVVHCDQHTK